MKNLPKMLLYFALLVAIFLCYCRLETYWIKNKKLDLISKDIPKSFVGKKMVFISDIHHGPFLSIKRVRKIVDRINALQPDIIILGGDYVHQKAAFIEPVFDAFKNLKPKIGIYAVLGNHDHWEDAELTKKMMDRNGINLCDNKSYWIELNGERIKIGGVGDLWKDTQILDSTTHDLKQSDFCVFVSHNPDYLEKINNNLIDFTLSGHTHGGQMTFFGLWAPILPSSFKQKYRYGLKQFGNMQSYISSGIGTITPPLRFFCRPEIVIIELKN